MFNSKKIVKAPYFVVYIPSKKLPIVMITLSVYFPTIGLIQISWSARILTDCR